MSKYINSGTGRRTVGNSDAGILRVFVHSVCICVCVCARVRDARSCA